MEDCLFCKIRKKEMDCKMLYEDEEVFVFLDIDQSTPGHTLIIPKKHVNDYTELDKDTLKRIFEVAEKVSEILMRKLEKTGISLLFNYGDSQVIKHTHLHLLPNFLEENETKSIEEVYALLKDEF